MAVKINGQIVKAEVVTVTEPPETAPASATPKRPEEWKRPFELAATATKIKPSDGSPALYVIITKDDSGQIREIFANTKHNAHMIFLTAITRTAAQGLRKGVDPADLADEWLSIRDEPFWADIGGKSMLFHGPIHALGWVLQRALSGGESVRTVAQTGTQCPECKAMALVRSEGCDRCQSCGYSKCG